MKGIVIDITSLLQRLKKSHLPTGIERVVLAYVEYYQNNARVLIRFRERNYVLPHDTSFDILQFIIKKPKDYLARVRYLFRKDWLLQRMNQDTQNLCLLNLDYGGLKYPRYTADLKKLRIKSIFMVHDLIPITHAEFFQPGSKQMHTYKINQLIAVADAIITNSEYTLTELHAYAQRMGLKLPRNEAMLLAAGLKQSHPMAARPVNEPYFVMLGTIEPRKNHALILHVWRQLAEKLGKNTPRLIIIGKRGWHNEQVIDLLERCHPLQHLVIEASLSDEALANYLQHAQALLCPSFIEGYGLPIVEALQYGIPVLVSDIPAFREVAHDVPDYINPIDGKEWLVQIENYTQENHPNRLAQRKRLEKFAMPVWTAHFDKVNLLVKYLMKDTRANMVAMESSV